MSDDQREREPIPWLWLGMGLLLTIIVCALAMFLLNTFLTQRTALESAQAEATIIVLTAPPLPTIEGDNSSSPPTPMPTFTPIPTPDSAVAPDELTSAFYGAVANTDGLGVTVRGVPNTRNVALLVAEEGTILLILAGPEEGDNFDWWQVRLDDGTEGWVAEDFLEPAAAP